MNTSNARHTKICDSCGAELPQLYPDNKDNISVELEDISKHNSGDSEVAYNKDYASRRTFHACSEACMASLLAKRAKARSKAMKSAKANIVDEFGNVDIDITSDAAYISTHDRNKLGEEHFLDPKRRSFPIRPGHECTDLNAALHRIGTYKGELSHEELHSKILSRMKSHGCPLPKSDK